MPKGLIVAIAVSIGVLIPVAVTLVFSLVAKRLRWIAPLASFLVFLFLLLKSVFGDFTHISWQVVGAYLRSDAAIEFPLLYLPLFISALGLTVYLAITERKHRKG